MVHDALSNPVENVSMTAGQPNAKFDSMATSAPNANTAHIATVSRIDPLLATILSTPTSTTGVRTAPNTDVDLQSMRSSYAELSNKVLQYIHKLTNLHLHQHNLYHHLTKLGLGLANR